MRRLAIVLLPTLLAAIAAAGCASTETGTPGIGPAPDDPPERIAARQNDDLALENGAERLGFLSDHWLAVAGGELLGGTMLREDAARLLAEGGPLPLHHAYFFRAGEEGDRREPVPALYAARMAGDGLFAALGVDPDAPEHDGRVEWTLHLGPASGAGRGIDVPVLRVRGWQGTALVAPEDAETGSLAKSEIPGVTTLAALVSGRPLRCRRATAEVELRAEPDTPPVGRGVVEILFPAPAVTPGR